MIDCFMAFQSLVTITNDLLANQNQPFVLYKNPNDPIEALKARIWPTFSGSHDPFGPDVDINMLI